MKEITFPQWQAKNHRIPWYIRFCLWFIKSNVSHDFASNYYMAYKVFRGKIYIVREWEMHDFKFTEAKDESKE